MAARRRPNYLRHPRTTQELRANSNKWDPLVRAKRRSRRVPNAWDDLVIRYRKSWKDFRRTQWRDNTTDFAWRSIQYDYWIIEQRMACNGLTNWLRRHKFYFKWGCCCVEWYGPPWEG